MKKIIILISLLFFTSSTSVAQSCEELESDLLSGDSNRILPAVEILRGTSCPNICGAILTILKEQSPIVQYKLLNVLNFQEYPDISVEIYKFIDRADGFGSFEYPFDPLTAKVYATSMLFALGDYSTYEYVFELIDRGIDENKIDVGTFSLLWDISNQYPSLSTQIRSRAESILNTTQDIALFYHCVDFLSTKHFNDYREQLIEIYKYNADFATRMLALNFLCINNYPTLPAVLSNQLNEEVNWEMRVIISDTLLIKYGTPSCLLTLNNYYPGEPNETARTMMQYSVSSFIPPHPIIPMSEMIDSLDSYTDQLFQFGWIKNENDYTQYKEKTIILHELYEQKKFSELCSSLIWIISQAESQYGNDSLTEEGYKFLFYYTGYIKEKIESEFGECK